MDRITLLGTIARLRDSPISDIIESRLKLFSRNRGLGYDVWFSELSFCILVAASPARSGLRAQDKLGPDGFLRMDEARLSSELRSLGIRFHNRARYIVSSRRLGDFRERILSAGGEIEARDWLVRNVPGLGYKEASHFMRNVGFLEVGILDRHIVRSLHEIGSLSTPEPPTSRERYLQKERVLVELAKEASMLPGELDLYLWYMKTGDIVK